MNAFQQSEEDFRKICNRVQQAKPRTEEEKLQDILVMALLYFEVLFINQYHRPPNSLEELAAAAQYPMLLRLKCKGRYSEDYRDGPSPSEEHSS
ncbi:MAG: hypothetical protein IMZ61_02390 [Planctomycetes bacterium]|nr:hypothetical protein [Planctomycetota bacterium]